MHNFKNRIHNSSKTAKIILANDYINNKKMLHNIINNINVLGDYLCGVKINFHVILPMCPKDLIKINKNAHKLNLQSIADIKLNDIFDTNKIVIKLLHELEFDAVIVNPIMGSKNLGDTTNFAHDYNMGIISICHLSSLHSSLLYDSKITFENKTEVLHELFLNLAIKNNVDGVVIGATFPNIITNCKNIIKNKLDIYSPGIGIQGGNVNKAISAGADFLIVGRTIMHSQNQINTVTKIKSEIENTSNLR